jgi:hypothetical protein
MIPPNGSRVAWVEQANPLFEKAWQATPAVLALAQQVSRTRLPEFWKQYDEAGTADEPLTVSGIWLDPASGSADYEVNRNHDFDCDGLPELPDEHSIMISRDADGRLFTPPAAPHG